MTQYVSYDDYMVLKKAKEETDELLEESLGTIQLLKEKYDQANEENQQLQQTIASLTEERDRYKNRYSNMQEIIKQTQSEMLITKQLDEMLKAKATEKGLPNNAIEISKAILRSEIEFNEIEKKLVEDLKALADESCDCLVEIETDHSLLLERFPNVDFVKKEERGYSISRAYYRFDLKVFVIDPYKGIPRKTTTTGQPKGFLFGSPSKRFPVSPDIQDEDISFNEVEEIDEIGEDDEYDRE